MLEEGYAYIHPIDSDEGYKFKFTEFHMNTERCDCIFQTIGNIDIDPDIHSNIIMKFGDEYVLLKMVVLQIDNRSWESGSIPNNHDGVMAFTCKYCINYMDFETINDYNKLSLSMRTQLERIKLLEL